MAKDSAALKQWLAEKSGTKLPVITDELDLLYAGILDSLMLLELVSFLEEAYGFTVSWGDVDMDDFRTVTNILRQMG